MRRVEAALVGRGFSLGEIRAATVAEIESWIATLTAGPARSAPAGERREPVRRVSKRWRERLTDAEFTDP